MSKNKITRGNAAQFFVAGELCRRGYSAVVTLGNTPNTDVLCSNLDGTKFVHIQVKTFPPGSKTCSVGLKAENDFGRKFFWVISGIPKPEQTVGFEYYIIPSRAMAKNICRDHQQWLQTPGKGGRKHKDNAIRVVNIPPGKTFTGWSISRYRDRWDLIDAVLK